MSGGSKERLIGSKRKGGIRSLLQEQIRGQVEAGRSEGAQRTISKEAERLGAKQRGGRGNAQDKKNQFIQSQNTAVKRANKLRSSESQTESDIILRRTQQLQNAANRPGRSATILTKRRKRIIA